MEKEDSKLHCGGFKIDEPLYTNNFLLYGLEKDFGVKETDIENYEFDFYSDTLLISFRETRNLKLLELINTFKGKKNENKLSDDILINITDKDINTIYSIRCSDCRLIGLFNISGDYKEAEPRVIGIDISFGNIDITHPGTENE